MCIHQPYSKHSRVYQTTLGYFDKDLNGIGYLATNTEEAYGEFYQGLLYGKGWLKAKKESQWTKGFFENQTFKRLV